MAKNDPKYDTLTQIPEEPEDTRYSSSTEVDDDEKQWHTRRTAQQEAIKSSKARSKTSVYLARFRRFRWLIDTVLILVNISLSVLLLRGFWQELDGNGKVQVGGDYARAGPVFPTKVVKFEADESFVPKNTTEFFEEKTLKRWGSMMPEGTGWGEKTPESTFFTTSMTHQLHCVFMMARIYSAITGDMRDKLPSDYHSHYLHCVDYLRQGIMCSADLAMEPHEQTDPDDNGPMDGSWNGHHVCKDYSHVIPYLEEQIYDGIRMVLPIDD